MKEPYIFKNQTKLRWGYTTGTCAAAASMAAAVMLLRRSKVDHVSIDTPKGIRLNLDIEDIDAGPNRVSCGVKKDGGDDPDVTHGLMVYAAVQRDEPSKIEKSGGYEYREAAFCLKLTGGVGVGRVTRQGLSCEVGKPAINPVPRKMIFDSVAEVCRQEGFAGTLLIEISVPGAESVMERTFNGNLGILGGISILGTSGIVEPMSEAALLETIRLEIRQKVLEGSSSLIMAPGNYGEAFLSNVMGIGLETAVKCSNYIGASIDMAVEEGAKGILLVGHGGKLIKLAAGIMNTHSRFADGRMEILAAYGAACGAGKKLAGDILEAVTVDEGLRLLETVAGLRERVMERVMERIDSHLKRRAGRHLKIEALVFTNERGILGVTPGAEQMLRFFQ